MKNRIDWYNTTYRKLHLDWHQPPWIQKPGSAINRRVARDQARMFKASGVQAVEVFIYDHHGQAMFPSRVAVRHPHIKIDYPGIMIEALKAENLKVIGYLNVLTSIHLGKEHPDWLVRASDNSAPGGAWLSYPASWLCASSPYLDDHFLPLLAEVLERYPLDAIWLDSLSWMVHTPWPTPPCQCQYCHERFKKLTGQKPPLSNPANLETCSAEERALWFAWKTYRHGLVTQAHGKLQALIQQVRPGVLLTDNGVGQANAPLPKMDGDRFERWLGSSELLVDAFTNDPVPSGGNHELILSRNARFQITAGKPFDYMNERFHRWGEWQTRSALDWKLEFATILANGGTCFFADQPYADGSLEPEVYRELKSGYDFVKKLEPLCRDAKPVYEVGILAAAGSQHFSLPQLCDPRAGSGSIGPKERIAGAHSVATELGWQAHIFDEPTLRNNLDRLRVVIVPEQELLEDQTIQMLGDFVRAGGRLLLTGGCGRFDEQFRERARWPFESIAGVRFCGEWPALLNYFRVTPGFAAKRKDLLPLPVQCWGRAIRFKADGAQQLVGLSEPIADVFKDGKRVRGNFQYHTCTGACPPAAKVSGGAVFLNQCGKGMVMTMAVDPFTRYSVEGHRLLRGLIAACFDTLHAHAQRTVACLDKPLHIETHLMQQKNRLVFHCMNFFAQKRKGDHVCNEELSPTRPFRVRLRTDQAVKRVTLEPGGNPCQWRRVGGAIEIEIPAFEIHQAVMLSL